VGTHSALPGPLTGFKGPTLLLLREGIREGKGEVRKREGKEREGEGGNFKLLCPARDEIVAAPLITSTAEFCQHFVIEYIGNHQCLVDGSKCW